MYRKDVSNTNHTKDRNDNKFVVFIAIMVLLLCGWILSRAYNLYLEGVEVDTNYIKVDGVIEDIKREGAYIKYSVDGVEHVTRLKDYFKSSMRLGNSIEVAVDPNNHDHITCAEGKFESARFVGTMGIMFMAFPLLILSLVVKYIMKNHERG